MNNEDFDWTTDHDPSDDVADAYEWDQAEREGTLA